MEHVPALGLEVEEVRQVRGALDSLGTQSQKKPSLEPPAGLLRVCVPLDDSQNAPLTSYVNERFLKEVTYIRSAFASRQTRPCRLTSVQPRSRAIAW